MFISSLSSTGRCSGDSLSDSIDSHTSPWYNSFSSQHVGPALNTLTCSMSESDSLSNSESRKSLAGLCRGGDGLYHLGQPS